MTTLLDLIHAALKEDMPTGDLTTESLALGPRIGEARLIAKMDMVLSGSGPFEESIMVLEPTARIHWLFKEGDKIADRQVICQITGDLIQVLKAERVSLNFLGYLSGIATLTRKYSDKVAHTKTKILDTRKTIPTYRDLAKKAVVHGGGHNHRRSLSHAILIKDNHITVAGGLTQAVTRIREHSKEKIEVEASTLSQVREAVSIGVDCILLDNMNLEMMKSAIALIPATIEIEASGNMTLDRVGAVAELGVTYISVGALTHSAPTADVSLVFDWLQSEAIGI